MSTHRIHRQSWKVRVPTQAAAFAVRQQLRTALEGDLFTAFETAFEAMDVGDVSVHIPRIELSLRLREGDDIGFALREALAEQLPEVLRECVISNPERAGVTRRSMAADQRECLHRYLQSGRISWAHALPKREPDDLPRMLREEVLRWIAETTPADILASMRSAAQTHPGQLASVFRFLQLLPQAQREGFLAIITSPFVAVSPVFTPFVESTLRTPIVSDVARVAFAREQVITLLSAVVATSALGEQLRLRVMSLMVLLATEATVPDAASLGQLRACLAPAYAALPEVLRTHVERLIMHGDVGSVIFAVQAVPAPADDAPQLTRIDAGTPSRAQCHDPEATQGWLADDAGLVLLHPFLTRFLVEVGLLQEDDTCLREAVLPRAAALLHWLTSGRNELHEFELTTIKLLLGLEPDSAVLVTEGLLSDADRAEADALLAAVIAHWGALGKTGIAGLRTSFLQRRGLLRRNEQGWQLQVEPESFDMLLGKLPWGISIVKLPWMTRPIFTEWPTP